MRVMIVSCSYLLYEYLLKLKNIVLGLVLGLVILSSASASSSGFCPRPQPRPQEFGLDQHHCKQQPTTPVNERTVLSRELHSAA